MRIEFDEDDILEEYQGARLLDAISNLANEVAHRVAEQYHCSFHGHYVDWPARGMSIELRGFEVARKSPERHLLLERARGKK